MKDSSSVGFGVKLLQVDMSFEHLKDITLRCEQLGYDAVWPSDHVLPVMGHPPSDTILECWTMLSALAPLTRRIRLGIMALCNLFRHPSVLAKMSSTLDVVSGGRLDFGIGAGWFKDEALAYGIPFPGMKERAARLDEAIRIIKLLWTEEKATFKGRYYQINEAVNEPKPLQKPHPPLWVAGKGEKLMLPLVAKHADGSNFDGLPPEECRRKIQVLEQHCASIGKDSSAITKSVLVHVYISEDESGWREAMRRTARQMNTSVEDLMARKPVCGTPDKCAETVQQYVDAGIQYFTLSFPSVVDVEPLELFAHRVIPSFQ